MNKNYYLKEENNANYIKSYISPHTKKLYISIVQFILLTAFRGK